MKGKWAAGIPPRNFVWIIKDQLAASERPGGYGRNHRPVRRQEEIIWLREQGFTRVVSLLPSPHNLHAYDELGVRWEHVPFGAHDDPGDLLDELYPMLQGWLAEGEKVLIHQEQFGDIVAGLLGGYLIFARLVPSGPQAITILEQLTHRPMGPTGRELVALATDTA